MNTDLRWFEKLFPPTYSFNRNDIPLISSEKENFNHIFKSYINGYIKDLDTESIKNIYHRVYIIIKSLNEASYENSENHPILFADSSAQTDFFECIWTSEELGILRRESESIKSEILKLKIQINELQSECNDKRLINSNLEGAILKYKGDLNETIKANQRLSILCLNLKNNIDLLENEASNHEHLVRRHSEAKEKLINQLNASKNTMASLKHEIMNIKIKYSAENELLKSQCEEKLNEITEKHQIQLNEANSLYNNSKLELFKKIKEFEKLNEAFESIKLHFGNTQYNRSDEVGDRNLLKNINYYSR